MYICGRICTAYSDAASKRSHDNSEKCHSLLVMFKDCRKGMSIDNRMGRQLQWRSAKQYTMPLLNIEAGGLKLPSLPLLLGPCH